MTSAFKSKNLFGLVLVGGKSTRMGEHKAQIKYGDKAQWESSVDLLKQCCEDVYVSCSYNFTIDDEKVKVINDVFAESFGPLTGIISAMKEKPHAAWLVMACDLPYFDELALKYLLDSRDDTKQATAFISARDEKPEPLCTIYEPTAVMAMIAGWMFGTKCPRKILCGLDYNGIAPADAKWLENINTPQEQEAVKPKVTVHSSELSCQRYPMGHARLASSDFQKLQEWMPAFAGMTAAGGCEHLRPKNATDAKKTFHINYFAALKDQCGKSSEIVEVDCQNVRELFEYLKKLYAISFTEINLRVAVNDKIASFDQSLYGGEKIVFIPPVAGG